MGKLKPIGSEKLEGMAKIQRMIEIARYKENKPQAINETESNEYGVRLADGMKYHIIKEKNGYVIKRGLNESTLDYMDNIKGRKYFSSYSEALRRLNLITKEINTLEGKSNNFSLFTEGEEGEKKYFLKRNTNEQAATPPAPAPTAAAPAPAPAPTTPAPQDTTSMETPPPPAEDEMTPPTDDTGEETTPTPEEEEKVTFKSIQKLTGKLGQKLRVLNSDEETKMSSKDVKYVINSILSALDLNNLEDDDRDEIISKMEGEVEAPEMGGEDMDTEDMDTETPAPEGEEVTAEPPPTPETQEGHYNSIDEDDYSKMDEMIEGIFSESKVDKILKRYFKLEEKERKILKNKKIRNGISESAETISQEVASKKFLKNNQNFKFVGKNNNKNLVFESKNNRVVIDRQGRIL